MIIVMGVKVQERRKLEHRNVYTFSSSCCTVSCRCIWIFSFFSVLRVAVSAIFRHRNLYTFSFFMLHCFLSLYLLVVVIVHQQIF